MKTKPSNKVYKTQTSMRMTKVLHRCRKQREGGGGGGGGGGRGWGALGACASKFSVGATPTLYVLC